MSNDSIDVVKRRDGSD